jgi:hypothetical protein
MNKITGRFYTSSKAKAVDPFDITYAKVFPTTRSAKAALQWFDRYFRNPATEEYEHDSSKDWDPAVYEVETKIILKDQVEV